MCQSFDDFANPTRERRRREIAAILAKGVLRLRRGTGISPDSAESYGPCHNSSESGQKALEVSATSSPHTTRG